MIAYTAWDGLQTIARQYDADLALVPGERTELAPRWKRSRLSLAARGFARGLWSGR
ncbi:MAG: hypothetical protein M3Q50_03410 [Chloroflexota bacterium]|nr:hypothetical protein [Chloroflexia bacterium]MDQ3225668.1 hypothetical protein [Chloroflexota bacterium]